MSSIKTAERQFRALMIPKKELNVSHLVVITHNTTKTVEYDGEVIECIGLGDWLIQ